ncbi:hypothetical protein KKH39_03260 [Patescibacteria group bacterium]|nr:hypothetical protein [Patescibacteria group bacterium]
MVKGTLPPPPRSSWFLYMALDVVILGSQLSNGILDPMMIEYNIGTLAVALFTLKYGYATWSKLETGCSIFVGISIALYLSVGPLAATACALAGISAASLPILKKVLVEKKQEDLLAWALAVTATFCSLLDGHLITGIWLILLQGTIAIAVTRLRFNQKTRG